MKHYFILALLLSCTALVAQKKNIGFVNADSLLNLIPGYSDALDRTGKFKQAYDKDLAQMQSDHNKKTREIDSMAGKDSPLIRQLRYYQLQQLEENKLAFQNYARPRLQRDSLQMALFVDKYRKIENAVGVNNKCVKVVDRDYLKSNRSDSVNYVNLNPAVAEKIKADIVLMSNPKKIGCVSKDSLLRSLPGYQESKMKLDLQKQHLNDTAVKLGDEINRMQREADSLRHSETSLMISRREAAVEKKTEDAKRYIDNETAAIAKQDSIQNAENYKRYDKAVEKVAVSKELFVVQDSREAEEMWREQRVVLIDVDAEVAKELGL